MRSSKGVVLDASASSFSCAAERFLSPTPKNNTSFIRHCAPAVTSALRCGVQSKFMR